MPLKIAYLLMRWLFGLVVLVSDRTVPLASTHRLRLTPSHRRPTSLSTGSAGNKSLADSHTSTRSPPDRPALLRGEAGHRHDRVFGPHRMPFRRDLAPGMLHRHGAHAEAAAGSAGASASTPSALPGDDFSPRVTASNSGSWQVRRKLVLSGLINEYERAA